MANQFYTRSVSASERLYRLLLLLYPRAFREEYAAEMLYAFRDAYDEASQQEGMLGMLRLWRDFTYDLIKTACLLHVRSWAQPDALRFAFAIESAYRTDIGRTRMTNQDNLFVCAPDDKHLLQEMGALFIVTDGMGDSQIGSIASDLATQRISEAYYRSHTDDPLASLREAFREANAAIQQMGSTHDTLTNISYPPGTTCAAAVLRDQTLYVANVGDSRAYVLHDGQLRQITRDHSLTVQLVERGEITPAQARTHAQRHLIYRALGMSDVEVDCFREAVQTGDTLLLCTDGLSNQLEDQEMRAILEHYDPEESVQRLIACANERGGPDNITAVVVRVVAG